MSVKDAERQACWNARDAAYKQAWALADKAARDKEQARQDSIHKAVQDGQRKIDDAMADAVTARAAARTVDDLAGRLASPGLSNSCSAVASLAATRTVLVFTDLLKRADP